MKNVLTIAIPTYRRTTYLREALDSAVNQTVPAQVVVVENPSDQNTIEPLVARYQSAGVQYVRNERNLGPYGNWNRCIQLCATPYLLILHDDDRLALDYVANLQSALIQQPDICVARFGFIDQNGHCFEELDSQFFAGFQDLHLWCTRNPAGVGAVFRCDRARQLGGYRETYRVTADLDFWFRMAESGRYVVLPVFCGWYRCYHSAERITTQLESDLTYLAACRLQVRRNYRRYQAVRRDASTAAPPILPSLSFEQFWRFLPGLSPRRLRYGLGLYVNSPAATSRGRWLRALFRHAGVPICTAAAWLRRGQHREIAKC